MSNNAPIILFVYNRCLHTRRTVDALKANDLARDSDLYIYADAARNEEALPSVTALRNYLNEITGFRNIYVCLREHNLGVDENVILGVSEVIEKHGRAIVMEDDLVTAPWFLQYMNDALHLYEYREEVACIHGYVYPVRQQLKEVFFLKGADCWGWATWKRGWDLFEPDGEKLLKEIERRGLQREFNFNNTFPYVNALAEQAAGRTTCWDIRWYASAFLKGKLTLYPGQSLVSNIGHDASGTHCGTNQDYDVILATAPLNVETVVQPDAQAYEAFADFFSRLLPQALPPPRKSWISRTFKKAKSFLKGLKRDA